MHQHGRFAARFATAVLLAASAVALLTGCDSDSDTPDARAGTAPCTAKGVKAEMAVGEQSAPAAWHAALRVTNVGKTQCRLEGTSELDFYASTGAPIERTQRALEGDSPGKPVLVAPGKKAEMAVQYRSNAQASPSSACPTPGKAQVMLPGDKQWISVSPPEEMAVMPPLCGKEIEVSPWAVSA